MSTNLYSRENKELKGIISQFRDAYRSTCETSRNDFMKTLSSGDRVPVTDRIYGEEAKAEFESIAAGYRERADKILDEIIGRLQSKLTEAPSTEAVNTISLLKLRNHITIEEVRDLLDRYGENPQVWKAISSIASDHKLFIEDHPLVEELKDVEGLKQSIDKTLRLPNEYSFNTSDGFFSLLDMQIDNILPTTKG